MKNLNTVFCNDSNTSLLEIINMFKNKEEYKKNGLKIKKGIFIHGNSKINKNLLINEIIDELNLKNIIINKNEISIKENNITIKTIKNKNYKDYINKIFEIINNSKDGDLILIDNIDEFEELESYNKIGRKVEIKLENLLSYSLADAMRDNVFVIVTTNTLNNNFEEVKKIFTNKIDLT